MGDLHPQAKAVLDRMAAAPPPPPAADDAAWVAARRRGYRAMVPMAGPPVPVDHIADLRIPGPAGDIPARLYRSSSPAGQPLLLYFHGGGFVVGDLETHDPLCRSLAAASGCVIVAVDYRLAPEHRFPAGLDDCRAAVTWALRHAGEVGGDPARIAVGGDSAGGTLAAVIARDCAADLALQVLIYPNTDFAPDRDYPSYRGPHVAPTWRASMDRFPPLYLPADADPCDPQVSPLRATVWNGLPPALIVTAGADPLSDEAALYAQRLIAGGTAVTYRPFPGQIHGFIQMGSMIDDAQVAIDLIARTLRGLTLG
jgi:acetyl esterase